MAPPLLRRHPLRGHSVGAGNRFNWAFGLNWWIWSCQGDVTGLCCIARRNGRGWRLRTGDKRGSALSPTRRTAFIAGLWFIGTFVFSIPAALLYDPVLSDANYILGGGADTRVAVGAFLEILTAIANIATAVVLFPILRRQSEAIALGYVTLRIVESTLILVGLVSLMSVVVLREDSAGAGADNAALSIAGQSLVAIHDGTFLLGPQFCAGFGNGLLLGYLMYKSGLVPRGMALLGLIGGPLAFAGGTAVLFGLFEQPSAPLFLLTIPEILWEASLALYLTFKGFRPSPILQEDARPALQT
jgi:Domain of unknown function (DUF4386)